MLHIGIFCTKNIFADRRNSDILACISKLCGEISLFPFETTAQMPRFDALIVNDLHERAADVLGHMSADSFGLVNTDRRGGCSFRRYSGTLITYGLNQKACITASSIIDDDTESGGQIQVCIQRSFPTVSGECAAVQEFPIHMHGLGAEITIALVGMMLVCGAKVDTVDKMFNSCL